MPGLAWLLAWVAVLLAEAAPPRPRPQYYRRAGPADHRHPPPRVRPSLLPYGKASVPLRAGLGPFSKHGRSQRSPSTSLRASNLRKVIEFTPPDRDQPGYDQRGGVYDHRYKPAEIRRELRKQNDEFYKRLWEQNQRLGKPERDPEDIMAEYIEMETPNVFGYEPSVIEEIQDDNQSLFRCISRVVYGDDTLHLRVRRELTDWFTGALDFDMAGIVKYREDMPSDEKANLHSIEMREALERFYGGMTAVEAAKMRALIESFPSDETQEKVAAFVAAASASKDSRLQELSEAKIPLNTLTELSSFTPEAILDALDDVDLVAEDRKLVTSVGFSPGINPERYPEQQWQSILLEVIPSRLDIETPESRLATIEEAGFSVEVPENLEAVDMAARRILAALNVMTDEEIEEIQRQAQEEMNPEEREAVEKAVEMWKTSKVELDPAFGKGRGENEEELGWRQQLAQMEDLDEEGEMGPDPMVEFEEGSVEESMMHVQQPENWLTREEQRELWNLWLWRRDLSPSQKEAFESFMRDEIEGPAEEEEAWKALTDEGLTVDQIDAYTENWEEALTGGQKKYVDWLVDTWNASKANFSEVHIRDVYDILIYGTERRIVPLNESRIAEIFQEIASGERGPNRLWMLAAAHAYDIAIYLWPGEVKPGSIPQYWNPKNSRKALGLRVKNETHAGAQWDTVVPDRDLVRDPLDYNATIPDALKGTPVQYIQRYLTEDGEPWPKSAGAPPGYGWIHPDMRIVDEMEAAEREQEEFERRENEPSNKRGRGRPKRPQALHPLTTQRSRGLSKGSLFTKAVPSRTVSSRVQVHAKKPTGAMDLEERSKYRTALIETTYSVVAALGFGLFLYLMKGPDSGLEFLSGYLVEESLSVDNLFVFLLLFDYFQVPLEAQKRVLQWGFLGALASRGLFIGVGSVAIQQFKPVNLVFAGILIYSSLKLLLDGEEETEDLNENPVVQFASRYIETTDKYDGSNFFTTLEDGKKVATPLFLALVCIEISDVLFAVDSVPAVFGVTKDPVIVFTSNMFAILGLRSLYTVLSAAVQDLEYLQPSVAIILGFVGIKLVAEYVGYDIDTIQSLAVILGTLGTGIGASLIKNAQNEKIES